MKNPWITLHNVFDVAKLFSQVEASFIKQVSQKEPDLFIENFKKAFEYFNDPVRDEASAHCSSAYLFDRHLVDLIKATNNLYSNLTDKGQRWLEQELSQKQEETSVFRPH